MSLAAAIEELYRVFANYPLHEFVAGCSGTSDSPRLRLGATAPISAISSPGSSSSRRAGDGYGDPLRQIPLRRVGDALARGGASRRFEGVRRGGQLLHGRYVDMALYGLTREDRLAK